MSAMCPVESMLHDAAAWVRRRDILAAVAIRNGTLTKRLAALEQAGRVVGSDCHRWRHVETDPLAPRHEAPRATPIDYGVPRDARVLEWLADRYVPSRAAQVAAACDLYQTEALEVLRGLEAEGRVVRVSRTLWV